MTTESLHSFVDVFASRDPTIIRFRQEYPGSYHWVQHANVAQEDGQKYIHQLDLIALDLHEMLSVFMHSFLQAGWIFTPQLLSLDPSTITWSSFPFLKRIGSDTDTFMPFQVWFICFRNHVGLSWWDTALCNLGEMPHKAVERLPLSINPSYSSPMLWTKSFHWGHCSLT